MSDEKTEKRKFVSKLIFAVLTGKKRVLDCMKVFPSVEKDVSLEVAWSALMHYEADEELRYKDKTYADLQFDTLEYIAFCFEKGDDLPVNMIEDYTSLYKGASFPKKHGWFNLWGILDKSITIFDKK